MQKAHNRDPAARYSHVKDCLGFGLRDPVPADVGLSMVSRLNRQRRTVRVAVSAVNGCISLVVLLIAPLGLAAVITLTLLITLSTYGCCAAGDRLLAWLGQRTRQRGDEDGASLLSAAAVDQAPAQLRSAQRRLPGG